jgi:hypothetical protein
VRNAGAEWRLGGEMLRQMNWITVAGDRGKAHDIGGIDCLMERFGHANREILEIQKTQFQRFQGVSSHC